VPITTKVVNLNLAYGEEYSIQVYMIKEEFEDTRGTIRICKSKDRKHNSQAKEQTTIYKTLHKKLKIK
jgi:hypothetical protein